MNFERVVLDQLRFWLERDVVDEGELVRLLLGGRCEWCEGAHEPPPFRATVI